MLLTVLLHDYYIEFKVPEQVLYNTISTMTTITKPITITNTTNNNLKKPWLGIMGIKLVLHQQQSKYFSPTMIVF